MLSFHTKVFAHRGLHNGRGSAPENSLAAFRRAVDAGWGIELDIQLSQDRQVVVFHDASLNRMCGVCGRVRDYTWEELRSFRLGESEERIPLLSEVLALVDGKVPLIVELKGTGGFDPRLAELAAGQLDHYPGEYAVESFHPRYVYWFRRHRPLVRRGQLCTDFFLTHARGQRWQFFLLETQLTNFLTRPDFIAFDIRFRHHLGFRFWRHFCTPVGWTLRDPSLIPDLTGDFQYFIAERAMSSD